MRSVVVCQDLHPYDGGGISATTSALAATLAALGPVTFITPERHRARYEADGRRGVTGAAAVDVRFAGGAGDGFTCAEHAWSAHAWAALRHVLREGPVDLVHFPDYLGEAFVTLQARRAGEPLLRDT